MPKINNDLVKGVRGAIGKDLVYRRRGKETFISKYPDMSRVVASKNQTENRNTFSEAVKYAREVLQDPVRAAAFREKGENVYLAAVKEYMLLHTGAPKKYNSDRSYWQKELAEMDITDRQIKTALFIKQAGRLTNGDCRRLHGISKPSATRDLQVLVNHRILHPSAVKGAGAFYTMGSWWEEYRVSNAGKTK